MSELIYIPISSLREHPYNPRKNIGDVTELAESIKANGVLQNLTVVPSEQVTPDAIVKQGCPRYTILIGHRRFNAARLVGISELPCVVVEDMSLSNQIATMLIENIQRSDLSVYEEAKGFQMMIDLGMSVKEISAMSGFSETTVRKRTKLAELDEGKFKKAVDRGATLFDFAELDKIEDPQIKNTLLDSMGKSDFRNELKRELDRQKCKKKIDGFSRSVSEWASLVEKVTWNTDTRIVEFNGEKIAVEYMYNIGSWTTDADVKITAPSDINERRYFYTASSNEVDIYGELTAEMREKKEALAAERQKARDAEEAERQKYISISRRHYELRRDFVLSFNQYKQKAVEVAEFISDTMILYGLESGYVGVSVADLAELLGIHLNETEDGLDYQEYLTCKKENPERTMLIIAFWLRDASDEGFWERRWNSALGKYQYVYCENETLDGTYRLLMWMGYSMSTEESLMRNGTHKLFSQGYDPQDEEDVDI